MEEIIEILHSGNYACVIKSNGAIRTFNNRGVSDLYNLYNSGDHFANEGMIADKVVGKAAASLMVLLGLKKIYADIISYGALKVLTEAGIDTSFELKVPVIINRTNTGSCPLEILTESTVSPEEALPVITNFINSVKKQIK